MKTLEWAAGLFEGEGCIYAGKTPYNKERFSLHLGGKDKDVIDNFAEVMGVGNTILRKKKRKEEHSDIYMWQVYSKDKVKECLVRLLPHLGQRRAYKALNCLDDIELN